MNEITPLIKRAFMVVGDFSFEVIDDKILGRKYLLITDCDDENCRAHFYKKGSNLLEKVSSIKDADRRKELDEIITNNLDILLEALNG